MNKKLSDLASIAEIVSGIAVVVTLVFLVVGIRENTDITRADAFDRNIESLNQFRLDLAKDPELARIWQEQSESQSMEENDQYRLFLLQLALWGIYEKAYYANQYDLIGLDEWSRFEHQICQRMDDMRSERWERLAASSLTEQFSDYARTLCADSIVR